MKISLSELAAFLKAEIINGDISGKQCTGAAIDSRKLTPGQIFFALQGEKTDGHEFITAAAQAGAVAAVVEKKILNPPAQFPLIKVKDVKTALQQCAKLARQSFTGKVVAVTGSNGKTTTKDLLAEVLAVNFKTEKTFANYNNEIGLPLTIINCPQDTQALVLEMGMRARGEIALLADIAAPEIGIITNIGISHMELLKSQENIAAAKFELIAALPRHGTAVLNADDEWCVRLKPDSCKVIYYGFSDNADVIGTDLQISSRGTNFTVLYQEQAYKAFLPTWGKHNVLNALAAVAAGISLGMQPQNAIKGLKAYQPSPMRLEVKTGNSGFCILDDAYNANPISAAASLEVLRSITDGRTVAVLGEMYELGNMEEQGHIAVGEKAHQIGIDVLVTVGKKATLIAKGAATSGMSQKNIHVFANNETAINFLKEFLNPQDTVLIKGSRGMKMETIVSALT